MKKRVGFTLIALMMISFSFAGISVLEPQDVYNLGDYLYVTVDGIVGSDSGNFNVDLVCKNNTVNLVKIPSRAFSPEEENSYKLPYKILNEEDLEFENLTNLIGSCQIVAAVGDNAISTKVFTITDKVSVTASLDKDSYDPGEGINIKINAVKANGNLLNGVVEVSDATYFSKAVVNGEAVNVFNMAENTEAGVYYLNITAYDQGEKGILNKGSTLVSFEINQVPYSLVVSLSDTEATPGEDYSIGAEVYDQSGKDLPGTVSGSLVSPEGVTEEIVFATGESYNKVFATNSTPGIWKLRLFFDKLGEEREINVKEIQKVDLSIEDTVLVIKNIGNSLYNKTIDVQIGNETKELNLTIEVGEVRKFNLGAPKGEYEVVAGDGESEIKGQVLLTGKAISIKDLEDVGLLKSYSFVWIFLIFIFGGVGVVMFRKYRRTKIIDENVTKPTDGIKKKLSFLLPRRLKSRDKTHFLSQEGERQEKKKGVVDLTTKVSSAESALVLKGQKYASAVTAIKIKNYDSLNESARKIISEIVERNKDKGVIDWKDEGIFIIFTPLESRTYHNEMLATKVGFSIFKEFNDFNRRYSSKIEFNIGVNSGEIVATKVSGKLQYTSLGNTISLAKRIADSDSGKLLVSENIRKKGLRELKVEKAKEIGENPVYSVTEMKNKEANQAKLDQLLKRM